MQYKNMQRLVLFIMLLWGSFIGSLSAQERYSTPIYRARAVFIAVAKGDVSTLKSFCHPDFYAENFPYSDYEIKDILLSVPKEKRDILINDILYHSSVSTLRSRDGYVVTVIFTNQRTGKTYSMQFLDEFENDDWKVIDILQ